MSYCNFNSRLFKQFVSMKTKINPAMSDDWVIVPQTYNSTSGFSLKSEKLNQQVADIQLYRFLQFSGEQDLEIKGLKLTGSFIIGSDRSVYTEEMYSKWKIKYDSRTREIIPPKNYEAGANYAIPFFVEIILKKFILARKNQQEL